MGECTRNSPQLLVEQANSEGLGLVNELIVNKEQRFPDVVLDRERETKKYTYRKITILCKRSGISHQLLGAPRPFGNPGAHSVARLCGVSQYGGGEFVSDERGCV